MENLGQENNPRSAPSFPGDPPGETSAPKLPPGLTQEPDPDPFLDIVIDALHNLDPSVQGTFLQRFLTSFINTTLSENESITHWQAILHRRNDLARRVGRPVSFRTAAVDYFDQSPLLRNHILVEYGELKRLRHTATTDPLTGLYNRRFFQECLVRELNRSTRYASHLALLMLDLRSLKTVNDTYGHPTGDEVLRRVGRACVETVRGSDIPCRIGGDEFAILLPETERRSAEGLAERIVAKFEEDAKPLVPKVGLGLDYGVASCPIDGEDEGRLFEAVDRSLYANKNLAYGQKEARAAAGPTPPEVRPAPLERPPTPTNLTLPPETAAAHPEGVLPPARAREPLQMAGAAGQHRRPARSSERIPFQKTQGLALLHLGCSNKLARVLDLSLGGVGLLVDEGADFPGTFNARLRVPFLPRAEFTLHRVYSLPATGGKRRIGCSFTPVVKPASAATEAA